MNQPRLSPDAQKELSTMAGKTFNGTSRESQRLFSARATDDLIGTQNEKIPLLAQLIESVLHEGDEQLEVVQHGILKAVRSVLGKYLHEGEKKDVLEKTLELIAAGMKVFNETHQPPMSPELLAAETKALQAFIRKAVMDTTSPTVNPPLLFPTGYSE